MYIRVSGTTRPADRDTSRELYYECDGRSYDSVIRIDLKITEKDIQNLCKQMKEVALANCKSDFQRETVKDVTKNVLLSWGILKTGEDGKLYPTNAYVYLTGQDQFILGYNAGHSKERRVPYSSINATMTARFGNR